MKALIEHSSVSYLMTPEQAAEVLALMAKYGTEHWTTNYERNENNDYVQYHMVVPSVSKGVEPIQLKLIPDEAYGVAKMRYLAKTK